MGAGVFASAAGMDKEYTKKLLASEGIDVGNYVVVRRGESVPVDLLERLGLPVFVKPARAGSSVGMSCLFGSRRMYRGDDPLYRYLRYMPQNFTKSIRRCATEPTVACRAGASLRGLFGVQQIQPLRPRDVATDVSRVLERPVRRDPARNDVVQSCFASVLVNIPLL